MRRYGMIVAVVAVLAVAGSYVAFGQQNNRGGMMGGGMMGQRGGMMGMMRGMMAQSISHEAMVATSDGGVVVWANGKLIKYDSNLKLVKEVELNVNYETMQQRMQKMMENMPMMRGGMMGGSAGGSGGNSNQP